MQRIKIIHEPIKKEPYVIVEKPAGLPSAPLDKNDEENAFSKVSRLFPKCLAVKGKKEIEHGLLHRIDTETSGILLIAENQDFYDFIIEEQKNGRFVKKYIAFCNFDLENWKKLEGFPEPESNLKTRDEEFSFSAKSFFRYYGKGSKEVRPVTEKSGEAAIKKIGKKMIYETKISLEKIENEKYRAKCEIKQGFRHQVRVHLAWNGFPVAGDALYNAEYKNSSLRERNHLEFYATEVDFFNPFTQEMMKYKTDVETTREEI